MCFYWDLGFQTRNDKAQGSHISGCPCMLHMPVSRKEINMRVVEVPAAIHLNRPFPAYFNLANQTDRPWGPFEVSLSLDDSQMEKPVGINGLKTLNLIAAKLGVQKIAGIIAFDTREENLRTCSRDGGLLEALVTFDRFPGKLLSSSQP